MEKLKLEVRKLGTRKLDRRETKTGLCIDIPCVDIPIIPCTASCVDILGAFNSALVDVLQTVCLE
jgi:hypothetical protein